MTILAIGQQPPFPLFRQVCFGSGTGGFVSLPFDSAVRAGSMIFCLCMMEDGTAVPQVEDDQGNLYVNATTLTSYDASNRIQCQYTYNVLAGTLNVSLGVTGSLPRVNMIACEFIDVMSSADPLDQNATGSVADDPTSGSVVTTTNKQLIVGASISNGSGGAHADAGAGFMRVGAQVWNHYIQVEARELFVAGSIAANWITPGAATGLAQIATFKARPL